MRADEVWARVMASVLLPGVGQAMCGRRGRAVAWGIVGLVAALGIGWTIWLLYGGLAVRVLCAIDTFRCTRRATPTVVGVVVTTAALGAVGVGVFLVGFEAFETPSTSMLPTLAQGDKLYVDTISHHVRPPARGEVVVFRQPCMPERQYVKRIVAVAGDTVEVRCGVVHLNGKAMPAELIAARRRHEERDEEGVKHEREVSHYRETIDGTTFEIFDDTERADGGEDQSQQDFPDERLPSCMDSGDPDSSPSSLQPELAIVRTNEQAGMCERKAHVVVPPGTVFVMGDSRNNSNDSRYWGVVPRALVIGRVIGVWSPLGRMRDL